MTVVTEQAVLAVEDISKSFGSIRAVDHVSFRVRRGEIFGFLGPNGAGKTTTLRMLMGITAPDSGAVLYEGSERINRRRVGYLPEERGLFEDASVLETLTYFGSLRGMRAEEARAAASAGLARMDLAGRARDRVSTLSKGNQQKVQLIAAILHRPTLVVLDEPFSGLDPLNQELFIELMRELRSEGTAVLLSAHQLDLVERLADSFLLLSHGREVLGGPLEEMRRRTTGGRDTVLSLDLCCPSGDLEVLRNEHSAEIHGNPDGSCRADLLLAPGTDMAPILALISRSGQIRNVETRRLRLHEIYLQAVRQAGNSGVSEDGGRESENRENDPRENHESVAESVAGIRRPHDV
jgi:ABC-2 type transport system ATP-binding protein